MSATKCQLMLWRLYSNSLFHPHYSTHVCDDTPRTCPRLSQLAGASTWLLAGSSQPPVASRLTGTSGPGARGEPSWVWQEIWRAKTQATRTDKVEYSVTETPGSVVDCQCPGSRRHNSEGSGGLQLSVWADREDQDKAQQGSQATAKGLVSGLLFPPSAPWTLSPCCFSREPTTSTWGVNVCLVQWPQQHSSTRWCQ